jgi:hypothetical protein
LDFDHVPLDDEREGRRNLILEPYSRVVFSEFLSGYV